MKKIAYVLIIALFISLLTPLVSSAASTAEIPDGLYDYLKQQILEMNESILQFRERARCMTMTRSMHRGISRRIQ